MAGWHGLQIISGGGGLLCDTITFRIQDGVSIPQEKKGIWVLEYASNRTTLRDREEKLVANGCEPVEEWFAPLKTSRGIGIDMVIAAAAHFQDGVRRGAYLARQADGEGLADAAIGAAQISPIKD